MSKERAEAKPAVAPFEFPESQWKDPIEQAVRAFVDKIPAGYTGGSLPEEAIGAMTLISASIVNAVRAGIPFAKVWAGFSSLFGNAGGYEKLHYPMATSVPFALLFEVAAGLSSLVHAQQGRKVSLPAATGEVRDQVAEVIATPKRKPWQRPQKDRV